MPKRNKSAKTGGKRVEVVSGSLLIVILNAATSGSFSIQASNASFVRLAEIANTFSLYRFTKLNIKFMDESATRNTVVLGYYPTIADTPPTTISAISSVENSAVNFASQTTPSKISVSRSFLLSGPIPWYKTVAGAAEDSFEIQGTIVGASSASSTCRMWIDYTCELTSWMPIGSTPKLSIPAILSNMEPESRKKLMIALMDSSVGSEKGSLSTSSQGEAVGLGQAVIGNSKGDHQLSKE